MSCSGVAERLSAYIDGMLSGDEAKQVASHLEDCPECARELAALRRITQAASQIPQVELPAGLKQAILTATAGKADAQPWFAGIRAILQIRSMQFAAAAAAAVVLVAVLVVQRPSDQQGRTAVRPKLPSNAIARVLPAIPLTVPAPEVVVESAAPHVSDEQTSPAIIPATQPIPQPGQPQPRAIRQAINKIASSPEQPRNEAPAQAVAPAVDEPLPVAAEAKDEKSDQAATTVMASAAAPAAEQAVTRADSGIIKIAVTTPSISKDSAEWIKQMKQEAARQKRGDAGSNDIELIRSNF